MSLTQFHETCPKCGGKIGSPKYCTGGVGDWCHVSREEHLHYACIRCGYSYFTPTDDAAKTEEHDQEETKAAR